MNKSIGILYLCTGPYKLFWDDYYNSFEKNFMTNLKKHYYVFSETIDSGLEKYQNNSNVTFIHIDSMPWPLITLLRFKYFLDVKDKISAHDYLMFSNSNLICNKIVNESEFLPDESRGEYMSFCQHPGYWKTSLYNVPYERRKKSNAYIPYNCGETYVIGALFAGKTDHFLRMSEILNSRISDDLKKNIIAKWHDESHLNRYLIGKKDYKLLSPSFCYPVGFDLPLERIICGVSKQAKFDVASFKGTTNNNSLTIYSFLKKVVNRLKNEGFLWYIFDLIFTKKIKKI